jgi:peptidoglycan/xylan/chitin deacetylase (PgdA/CDA1 family)
MLSSIKRRIRNHLARRKAVILTYHGVLNSPLPFPLSQHVGVERFEWQMRYLAEHCLCVSLSRLLKEIRHGRIEPHSVAVTFDDGFRNNYTTALPILRRYGVPATIFLPAGYIGTDRLLWPEALACSLAASKGETLSLDGATLSLRTPADKVSVYQAITRHLKGYRADQVENFINDLRATLGLTPAESGCAAMQTQFEFLSWDEVRAMQRSGLIEIGSHSVHHRRLAHLSPDEARDEITESKRMLERELGEAPYFAYPYGGRPQDFSDIHREMAIAAGYRAIITAMHGTVHAGSDPYELPRVYITCDTSDADFDYLIQGGAAFMTQ